MVVSLFEERGDFLLFQESGVHMYIGIMNIFFTCYLSTLELRVNHVHGELFGHEIQDLCYSAN